MISQNVKRACRLGMHSAGFAGSTWCNRVWWKGMVDRNTQFTALMAPFKLLARRLIKVGFPTFPYL